MSLLRVFVLSTVFYDLIVFFIGTARLKAGTPRRSFARHSCRTAHAQEIVPTPVCAVTPVEAVGVCSRFYLSFRKFPRSVTEIQNTQKKIHSYYECGVWVVHFSRITLWQSVSFKYTRCIYSLLYNIYRIDTIQ